MTRYWREWYLQDGKYKICRGERDGDAEVSMYIKNDNDTYDLYMEVIGLAEADTDVLAEALIARYAKEKEVP